MPVGWKWRLAFVLVGVVLWSHPGMAAKIERFKDKEGVLHIKNAEPEPVKPGGATAPEPVKPGGAMAPAPVKPGVAPPARPPAARVTPRFSPPSAPGAPTPVPPAPAAPSPQPAPAPPPPESEAPPPPETQEEAPLVMEAEPNAEPPAEQPASEAGDEAAVSRTRTAHSTVSTSPGAVQPPGRGGMPRPRPFAAPRAPAQ